MSSTMRWPILRSSSQPRASRGSRLRSSNDFEVFDERLELDEEFAVFREVAGFLIVLSGEAPDRVEGFPQRDERELGAVVLDAAQHVHAAIARRRPVHDFVLLVFDWSFRMRRSTYTPR